MRPGDRLTLAIEKPAVGGRMIARAGGAIVLVSHCIPGEVVAAVVEKVQRQTIWARPTAVLEASPDRTAGAADASCGGNTYAHIRYPRQLALKQEMLRDAWTRIGRLPAADPVSAEASPSEGYRMRARLHVRGGRAGLYREGTHDLCEAASTRQLLPAATDAIAAFTAAADLAALDQAELELAENMPATERVLHLELPPTVDPSWIGAGPETPGLTGLSCGVRHGHRALALRGSPVVTDTFTIESARGAAEVSLARHAHAFFQGNRFLLPALTGAVVAAVEEGPVLDLYAGVGLFAVAVAASGIDEVTAVEGDRRSVHDLRPNAHGVGGRVTIRHQAVEDWLAAAPPGPATVIVDPPRTGLSRDAVRGIVGLGPRRLVYVSCDVATLARDARLLVDAGYRVRSRRIFDLFPNTPHVETLVVFDR